MKIRSLCAIAALLVSPLTQAAFVTIQDISGVFSQASFGQTPVDIRIGATTQLVRPDLLDITTDAQIGDIFSQHVGAQNIVNFYFIDTLSRCGGVTNVNFIGCGELPGQDFIVESVFAANTTIPAGGNITFGIQLLAHELGHNLGLDHRPGNDLMNASINGFQDLDAAEVATILGSPLVQTDALTGRRFIQINPVLVVSANVPEPPTLLLLLMGLVFAGMRLRKLRRLG